MPLLGLFSKRDKHKPQQGYTPYKQTPNSSDIDGDSYSIVETVESSLPTSPSSSASPPVRGHAVYGNHPHAASASSSKIKLGFRRKKSSTFVRVENTNPASPPLPPVPRPPYSPSAQSEPDVERFRPPAKGALFSAYGDPQGALSTRSLPTNQPVSHSRSHSRDVVSTDNINSADVPPPPPPQPAKKSGGLFSWVQRDRKKSQPATLRPPERPPPRPSLDMNFGSASGTTASNMDSFNLKSFRHVGPVEPPSPELPGQRPPSALSSPFNTPPARPRENSVASDASQRISVAAFREAAARRAHSPSPSIGRPPSRTELSSSRLEVPSPRPSLGVRPALGVGSSPSLKPSPVRNSALRTASSDGSSSSESESEESDEEEATVRPKRGENVTQRNVEAKSPRASSELGHRLRVPAPGPARVARSTLGHGEDKEGDLDRSKVKSDMYGLTKDSTSMSALQSNAAADRPSTIHALASSGSAPARHQRTTSSSSESSNSSSSGSDSDDAPLATLIMPKRPGSSASNATSGSRARMPSKPLIDISSLGTPALPMPLFGETSLTISPTDEKFTPPPLPEKDSKCEEKKPTLNDRLARVAQTAAGGTAAKSVESLSNAGPIERRGGSLDLLRERENLNGATASGKAVIYRGRNSPQPPPPTRSQTAPIGFNPPELPTFMSSTPPQPEMTSSTPPPANVNRSHTPDPGSPKKKTEKRTSISSSPNPNAFVDLTDPTPIRPTPIRSRSPPQSFSVTSRPASQMSLGTSGQPQFGHSHTQSQSTIQGVQPPRPESRLRHEQPTVRMIGATAPVTSSVGSTSTSSDSESSDEESESDDQSPSRRRLAPLVSSRAPTTSISPQPRPRRGSEVLRAPPPRTSSMYALDPVAQTTKLLIPASTGAPSIISSSSASSSPVGPRQRSSTLVPNGGADPPKGFTGGGLLAAIPSPPLGAKGTSATKTPPSTSRSPPAIQTSASGGIRTRQRSSTMFESSLTSGSRSHSGEDRLPERPAIPFSTSQSSSPVKPARTSTRPPASQLPVGPGLAGPPPPRPFAVGARRNSPTASSAGDSSSTGRTPLTPRDGSDIGVSIRGGDSDIVSTRTGRFSAKEKEKWGGSSVGVSSGGSAPGSPNAFRKGHKITSVSFDEPEGGSPRGRNKEVERETKTAGEDERRRERRRSEAKASIELGNVVNGRGPISTGDDDEDLPLNTMGPRMNMNMMNPMLNLTPPTPMTWRPPSTMMGGMNPMNHMNMFPVPPPNADPAFLAAHQQAMMVAKQAYQYAVAQQAMAQANEEWERGSSATSAFGGGSSYGAMGMGGMNMGMGGMGMSPVSPGMFPPYGMWSGPMMFPSSAQSMYAGSELGASNNAGWGSRSAYGDTGDRPPMHRGAGGYSSSASAIGVRTNGRPRTKTAPSSRQPPPPPSSWRKPS